MGRTRLSQLDGIHSFLIAALLLVAFHSRTICGFAPSVGRPSLQARISRGLQNNVKQPISSLHRPTAPLIRLHESSEESKEEKPIVENDDGTQSSSSQSTPETNQKESNAKDGGVVRTVLLAGPLFCKFVIVLIIKFLTDLVVYPSLVLYRMARLMKRRVLRMWRSQNMSREKPNGEDVKQ